MNERGRIGDRALAFDSDGARNFAWPRLRHTVTPRFLDAARGVELNGYVTAP